MNATEKEFSEDQLQPGTACPVCGEPIVTYFSRQLREPEEMDEGGKIDDFCWLPSEDVEPSGLNNGFSGNVVLIDHHGPSL